MRVAVGKLIHETNTMSNQRVSMEDFAARELCYGAELLEANRDVDSCTGGFIDVAEREGFELVPLVAAASTPGGKVTEAAYEELKGEFLDRLADAAPLDGVLLDLHGAMVVEGELHSAEGDFTAAVRAVVGDDTPVVGTADPHGNVSAAFVDNVDALTAYDTIPHTDQRARGVEAAETLLSVLRGECDPVTVRESLPMMVPSGKQLVGYENARGPLPGVFEAVTEWEKDETVLDVSVFVGFDRSDVPDVGASVVVTTDGAPDRGREAAATTARRLWESREEFLLATHTPDEAVEEAMRRDGQTVVLADMEDAPSGGGTGDGTEILRTMIRRGVDDGAVWLSDPDAVAGVSESAVGDRVTLTVGGKRHWRSDGKHAEPTEISGRLRAVTDGEWTIRGPSETGALVEMGRTIVVDVDGIAAVVSERRIDPKDPELFRAVGVEPTRRKMVVVKSKHHWRAAWEPEIDDSLVVRCPSDYSLSTIGVPQWDYDNVPRPIWPLDDVEY
jgi:microcystin degradation protein MlrC